jgi:hypothetical protein
VRRLWSSWVALSSTREDMVGLAAARIVIGATIVWELLQMQLSGAAVMSWVHVEHGGVRNNDAAFWLAPLGGNTAANVQALTIVGIVAAALVAVGAATRVSLFVTWVCFHALVKISPYVGGGADTLLVNGLFVLFWSGCGRALSVDQWWRRRRDPAASSEAPAWPRYVLIYQLVTVYWTTGIQKVSNSWWPPPMGTLDAIYYILQQPNWQRWELQPLLAICFRLTQAMTLSTWVFELGSPLLLLAFWFRHTRERPGRVRGFFNAIDFRLRYVAFGACLHLGIWALMEVGPFLQSVTVCYCACVTPAEWRAALARLRRDKPSV